MDAALVEPLDSIHQFRLVQDHFGTAGQPTLDQFHLIKRAGFQAVINLALPNSDNALPNEGSIVTALGLPYIHIPVDFARPTIEDFERFAGIIKALEPNPIFIHCAANMRVSAFVYLYRVLNKKVPRETAEKDLLAIWKPEGVWKDFIDQQVEKSESIP